MEKYDKVHRNFYEMAWKKEFDEEQDSNRNYLKWSARKHFREKKRGKFKELYLKQKQTMPLYQLDEVAFFNEY